MARNRQASQGPIIVPICCRKRPPAAIASGAATRGRPRPSLRATPVAKSVLGEEKEEGSSARQNEARLLLSELARQVVNQAVGILDVASRKIRLVLNDLATTLNKPQLGFFYTVHGYL